MTLLVLGLLLFLGMHSVSIVAVGFRDLVAAQSRLGWAAFYSLVSLVGLYLIVRGYGTARLDPVVLYTPPLWLHRVASILLLPVFILFFAPYLPGRIKTATVHPQLLAVMLWSVAHLLANGTLADVVLFGAVLVWAVADRLSMNRRVGRPVPGAPPSRFNDGLLIVIGIAAYVLMVTWLHKAWFGVAPL
ncbi:MAG TPA: NnrU family protein [Woeseiaceae bacterium]|nr:NnrU family protein [Woeseiaceae bacterium]